jgi:hypothetical protein
LSDISASPLPCPLYVSAGAEDPRCIKESVEAWKDCSITCQVRYFKGGHHYLLSEDDSKIEFLNYVSDILNTIILTGDLSNVDLVGNDGTATTTNTNSGGVVVTEEVPTAQQQQQQQNIVASGGGGGGGPGSVKSMSSDAGATVASGSSYAAVGLAGNTSRNQRAVIASNNNSGSVVRSRTSLDDGRSDRDEELEGHDDGDGGGDKCGSWRTSCCCF